MRMVLDICREYGQSPSWWNALPRGDQLLLLGDLRVRSEDAERAVRRARAGGGTGQPHRGR